VHLKGIHILNIDGCPNITNNAIVHLKGIHSLNISGCPKITSETLQAHLQGIHSICTKDSYNYFYNKEDDEYVEDDEDVKVLNSILPGTLVKDKNDWTCEHFDYKITNIASCYYF
jgi:hypothetical protein